MKNKYHEVRSLKMQARVIFLYCFMSLGLLAQTTSTAILGNVTDPSGAAVVGADVSITNLGTAQTRRTTTNEAGFYNVPGLNPGSYKVTIEKSGFKTQV